MFSSVALSVSKKGIFFLNVRRNASVEKCLYQDASVEFNSSFLLLRNSELMKSSWVVPLSESSNPEVLEWSMCTYFL